MFFDVDDTLCDFTAMLASALEQTAIHLRERFPALDRAGLSVADLQRQRDVAAEIAPPGTPLMEIRRRGFAATLAPVTDDTGEAERVTAFFLERRYAASVLFEDVRPTLHALRARGLRLGVLTNGNAGLETLNLHDLFDLELVAETIGLAKPDPEVYHYAARRADCPPAEMVMVGDSYANDVAAARAAGWRAVLLDRSGAAGRPDAISTLSELGSLI